MGTALTALALRKRCVSTFAYVDVAVFFYMQRKPDSMEGRIDPVAGYRFAVNR